MRPRSLLLQAGQGANPIPSISGLVAWWKADAIIGLADGDAVATWAASSSSAYPLTQPTAGNRPVYKVGIINKLPVVRFTAASKHYLTGGNILSNLANVTVFSVFKSTTAASNQWIVGKAEAEGNGFSFMQGLFGSGKVYSYVGVTGPAYPAGVSAVPALSNNTWYIGTTSYDGVTLDARVNGGQLGQTAEVRAIVYDSQPLLVGIDTDLTVYAFGGDLAEIVIYNRALSVNERRAVELSLGGKYALVVT